MIEKLSFEKDFVILRIKIGLFCNDKQSQKWQ